MNSPTKKEETMANQEQYRAVLEDLIQQREQHQLRVTEIEAAINALRRLMPEEQVAPKKLAPPQPMLTGLHGKYAGMNIRSAILRLLAEDASAPMRTVQIAHALVTGGITVKGKNFRANVAAVVSEMYRKRDELAPGSDGGWKITEKGRLEWLRMKPRVNPSSIFSEQPSVQ